MMMTPDRLSLPASLALFLAACLCLASLGGDPAMAGDMDKGAGDEAAEVEAVLQGQSDWEPSALIYGAPSPEIRTYDSIPGVKHTFDAGHLRNLPLRTVAVWVITETICAETREHEDRVEYVFSRDIRRAITDGEKHEAFGKNKALSKEVSDLTIEMLEASWLGETLDFYWTDDPEGRRADVRLVAKQNCSNNNDPEGIVVQPYSYIGSHGLLSCSAGNIRTPAFFLPKDDIPSVQRRARHAAAAITLLLQSPPFNIVDSQE